MDVLRWSGRHATESIPRTPDKFAEFFVRQSLYGAAGVFSSFVASALSAPPSVLSACRYLWLRPAPSSSVQLRPTSSVAPSSSVHTRAPFTDQTTQPAVSLSASCSGEQRGQDRARVMDSPGDRV